MRKHRTAQHTKQLWILSQSCYAWKVDKDAVKLLKSVLAKVVKIQQKITMFYMEDEEGVIKDLNKEFKELDEKLAALTDDEGGKIKAFRAEHHYLEKAKEILQKAKV